MINNIILELFENKVWDAIKKDWTSEDKYQKQLDKNQEKMYNVGLQKNANHSRIKAALTGAAIGGTAGVIRSRDKTGKVNYKSVGKHAALGSIASLGIKELTRYLARKALAHKK